MIRILVLLILCAMLGACGQKEQAAGTPGPEKTGKKLTIAVIPKGTTHSFWKTIHAGAAKAAEELGVEIVWKGPVKEDDRGSQIDLVANFVSRGGVDGVVLAPLDDAALVKPVEQAAKAGIKTVIIDSDLKSEEYVSFVATDNRKGGELCAKRLCELLGGKGKVLMLRYMEGSASTANREEGFLAGMKQYGPAIELLSTNQYAGATMGEAMEKATNLLNRFAEMDGIFCPNESSTQGMLRALQTKGTAGKVKFVGFDNNEALVAGLKEGQIHGLALQSPFNMGYLGVKAMVDALNGKTVSKRIDTGVVLLTRDNIDTPEMQALLTPDLSKVQ